MRINLDDGRYVNVAIRVNNKGTYEYSINNVLVGVYNSNVMRDSKFLEVEIERNNTIANELSAESKDEIRQIVSQVKEQVEQVKVEQIEEEARENVAIDGYLQELGVERENVKITFLDLEGKEKENKKEETRERKATQGKNLNGEIQEEQLKTKDIGVKQTVDLDERATDVESFRKWMGGKLPKEAEKVGVIDSNEMGKMKDDKGDIIDNSSTQLGLIVIMKDGKVAPLKKYIPELEQNHSSGNNPTKSQYQIHTDGTVEKDPVLSEYRIGRKIIQLDKDHGDDLEVNIGKYSPHGNELVTTRMRDRNTQFATDIDTRRAAMGHYKGVNESRDSYQEAQEHEKAGCNPEELTTKEIDGDKETGHQHIENMDEMYIRYCVKKVLESEEIASVYGKDDVRKILMEKMKNKEYLSSEELIEETKEQMEETAENERTYGDNARGIS